MKKIFCIIIVAILMMFFLLMFSSRYTANYVYDNNSSSRSILYGDDSYIEWSIKANTYCDLGVIENEDMYPFFLVYENLREKIYISDNFIQDLIPPYSYFSFCEDSNDFIFESPHDTSLNLLYIKEGFVFPDIENDEINEIWMSLSSDDNDNITDEKIVKKIVDCAKSKSAKELDKDIYDYISEKSWDNHHIYMKYKEYPLVEEFFVIKSEDGRYIIKQ
ncbi:MAG: hypothetical protein IKL10_10720 [Clostridia bacterium]|nr:hypothetical protein [Clostridia bacterium]